MLSPEVAKKYTLVPYNPSNGYPGHMGLYYRCPICGDIIPSNPPTSMACGCGNVLIELGSVRVRHQDKQPLLLKKRSIFTKLFGGKK